VVGNLDPVSPFPARVVFRKHPLTLSAVRPQNPVQWEAGKAADPTPGTGSVRGRFGTLSRSLCVARGCSPIRYVSGVEVVPADGLMDTCLGWTD
jgi:hypothetical protein